MSTNDIITQDNIEIYIEELSKEYKKIGASHILGVILPPKNAPFTPVKWDRSFRINKQVLIVYHV